MATIHKEEAVSYPVHWKSDVARFPQSLTWELSPNQGYCLPFEGFCGGLCSSQSRTYRPRILATLLYCIGEERVVRLSGNHEVEKAERVSVSRMLLRSLL